MSLPAYSEEIRLNFGNSKKKAPSIEINMDAVHEAKRRAEERDAAEAMRSFKVHQEDLKELHNELEKEEQELLKVKRELEEKEDKEIQEVKKALEEKDDMVSGRYEKSYAQELAEQEKEQYEIIDDEEKVEKITAIDTEADDNLPLSMRYSSKAPKDLPKELPDSFKITDEGSELEEMNKLSQELKDEEQLLKELLEAESQKSVSVSQETEIADKIEPKSKGLYTPEQAIAPIEVVEKPKKKATLIGTLRDIFSADSNDEEQELVAETVDEEKSDFFTIGEQEITSEQQQAINDVVEAPEKDVLPENMLTDNAPVIDDGVPLSMRYSKNLPKELPDTEKSTKSEEGESKEEDPVISIVKPVLKETVEDKPLQLDMVDKIENEIESIEQAQAVLEEMKQEATPVAETSEKVAEDATPVVESKTTEEPASATQITEAAVEEIEEVPAEEVVKHLEEALKEAEESSAAEEVENLVSEEVDSAQDQLQQELTETIEEEKIVIEIPKPEPSGDALSVASMFGQPNEVEESLPESMKNKLEITEDNAVAFSSPKELIESNTPQSILPSEFSVNEGSTSENIEVASIPQEMTKTVKEEGGLVSVSFLPDETDLPATARESLKDVVEKMKQDETKRLSIIGYASNPDDTASTARRVSLKRSLSIRKHLIDNGIDSTRINVQAMGNKYKGSGGVDKVDVFFIGGAG